MTEGTVESVKPLFRDVSGYPFWWEVKLKERPEPFALHRNWFALFGDLNPGEKVEYEVSKAKLDEDGSQGIDREGRLLFDKLRKIEKEREEWEEVAPEL